MLQTKRNKAWFVTPTRDFTFVADTSRFHSNNEYNRCFGEVANIGTGHEISIGETVELLSDLMGVSVTVIKTICEKARCIRVERLVACTSRAQELFGGNQNMQGAGI